MNANLQKFINKVYPGDVLELLNLLPDNSIDMIFSENDYNVGIKYEGKSYKTSFREYIDWYIELAKRSIRVLKDSGNFFLVNYPKQNAYLRVLYLDEACSDVWDYSWIYNTNIGHSSRRFTTAHRSILHCTKTKENKFYKNSVAEPYKNPDDKRIKKNINKGSKGRMPYDWFYFDLVKNISKEKTFHSCQIPQSLSEMLIKASTQEGDLVLIHFGGSGAELEVCQRLNRHFISAEIEPRYYEMIIDRLEKGYIDSKYSYFQHGSNESKEYQQMLFDIRGKYSLDIEKTGG